MGLGAAVGPIIGSALGGIGGAISGARGTPDQNQNTSSTSKTTLVGKSNQQADLEQQSYQQYLQQLQLADLSQQAANESDPYRQAALQQQLQVLQGNGFAPNAQEQQQIQAIRDATVNAGSADINRLLEQQMQKTVGSAAGRGLRGQALGDLQARVIDSGANQYGSLVNQANLRAAQQAISLPQQRLAFQQQAAGTGLSYAQQLQQQALQNRTLTQNPFLLQQLQQERLATGTQNSSGNTNTPGQSGSFLGALGGFFTGGAAGAGAGAQVQQAFQGYNSSPSTPSYSSAAPKTSNAGGSYGNYGSVA